MTSSVAAVESPHAQATAAHVSAPAAAPTHFVTPGFVLAFVAVSLAGALQAWGAARAQPLALGAWFWLLSASYALLGTLGLYLAERRGAALTLRGLLGVCALIASWLALHSHGYAAMQLLAVVSAGALFLPLRASVSLSVAAALVALLGFMQRSGVASALLQAEAAFGSGVTFVFVFSRIARRERSGRVENQRLLVSLERANAALREHAHQIELLATSAERNRIAREIHDGLGHYLTVVHMQLEAALTLLSTQPERARSAVATAQQMTQQGLNEVRRSVTLLRAESAPRADLIDALRKLVREANLAPTETRLRIEGAPRRIAEPLEFTLFRAAQEGLTNAHRHAHAKHVEVALVFGASDVALCVQDDGAGSVATLPGFGLTGLRERAELMGGSFAVDSQAGRGFRLTLTVPA